MLSGDGLIAQVLTWAPQNDVLGHPGVRAFLSHCGANSMYEVWHFSTLRMSCASLAMTQDWVLVWLRMNGSALLTSCVWKLWL